MSVVETSIEIATSPEDIWDVVMDPSRLDAWVTIHRKIDGDPELPLRTGSKFRQTLRLAGATFKVDWEVVELEAPIYARWVGEGPARATAEIEYRITTKDGVSHFAYRNEFRPPGGALGALAGHVLIGGISEREATRSLKRLKTFVEGDRCERTPEQKNA